MPGRTEHEAVNAFLEPLRRAVACVGTAHFTLKTNADALGATHAWTLNDGDRVTVKGPLPLWLKGRMQYEIADRGRSEGDFRFKVRTTGYLYSIGAQDREVMAIHWHPVGSSAVHFPHYHMDGPVIADTGVFTKRAHISSGRVSLESAVRFMIESMGAVPRCDDWSERLADSETLFREHRSWR